MNRTALLAISAVILMLSAAVVVSDNSAAETTGTITINGEGSVYSDLKSAFDAAKDGDTLVLSDGTFNAGDGIDVSKNVSLKGTGNSTITNNMGENQAQSIRYLYKEGYNITVSGINFTGYTVSGLLKWTQSTEYSSGTAKLTITDCSFSGIEGKPSNTGIGFFGNATATSDVTIADSSFDNTNMSIYLNDEPNDNTNIHVSVDGCVFSNSYAGVYGALSQVDVKNNVFMRSVEVGVDIVLNSYNMAKDAQTEINITGNTIDSVVGVSMAPYKLNENNGTGSGDAVVVGKENMPVIKDNVRNVDNNILTINVYRNGTDELLVLEENAIDLSGNYAAGQMPSCVVNASNADEVDADKLQNAISQANEAVSADEYYLDPDMETTNKDHVLPPIWDDDDDYVPPIVPAQPSDSGDDNTVTVVACAAAAVVAALMAAFLILDRKR